jgi:hypothetical protein
LCRVDARFIGSAYAFNLVDEPCFNEEDKGEVDEHPSDEKEFSIDLMEQFSWLSSASDSYYINHYYPQNVDEESSDRTYYDVDYLSHSGYAGAPEEQHNHEGVKEEAVAPCTRPRYNGIMATARSSDSET